MRTSRPAADLAAMEGRNLFKFRWLIPAVLALSLLGIGGESGRGTGGRGDQADQDLVIPPDAQQRAVQALQALGPTRGARAITSRAVNILGVSKAVSASRVEIMKSLKDLGAKETQTEYRIELPGDILFDFDQWDIRSDAEETLKKVASIIQGLKSPKVLVAGHTDSKGADDYNQKLSERRADAVKDWLIRKGGINADILTAVGCGENEPVASNTNSDGTDNPEGRRRNRRVEIVIGKT